MNETLEAAIFLSLNGRAREAIAFYQKNLDARLLLMVTYEDMKERDPVFMVTEENRHHIAHSVLLIGKTKLMIAEDTMEPQERYQVGNHFSLCVQSADHEQIQSFYERVRQDERARIIVPLASNVFSEGYGIIRDPFGIDIQFMVDKRLGA